MNASQTSETQQPALSRWGRVSKTVKKMICQMFVLGLLIGAATPANNTFAQSACLLGCQEALYICTGPSNPLPAGVDCQNRYDACVEACLSR